MSLSDEERAEELSSIGSCSWMRLDKAAVLEHLRAVREQERERAATLCDTWAEVEETGTTPASGVAAKMCRALAAAIRREEDPDAR